MNCISCSMVRKIFSLRIPRYSGYGWQKNEKKEKNNNCKALCVSCKRNKKSKDYKRLLFLSEPSMMNIGNLGLK